MKEQLELVRQSLLEQAAAIDAILRGIRDGEFLAEVNADVPLAADAPEPSPGIPVLTDVKPFTEPKAEVAEEEKPATSEISTEKYHNLCRVVIIGHEGKEVTKGSVTASVTKQCVTINVTQEDHLDFLRGIRAMLLSKKMDLKTALDQNGLLAEEKDIIEEFAKINNLK